jgi:hypothetical protein
LPVPGLIFGSGTGAAALAAVEAGKMGPAFVRDADVSVMLSSSWIRMVLGITDRNCRLLP